MKKISSILTLICTLFVCNAQADSKAREDYLKNLTTFFPTFSQNIGQIWPGMSVAANPVIVTFDNDASDTSLYAFNFTTQNPAWQKRMINNMPIYYMAQDTIGARKFIPSLTSFYFNLENKQALVYQPWFSEDSPLENGSFDFSADNVFLVQYFFMLHEISHSPRAKEMMANWDNVNIIHNDFNNADHLALLLIESAALDNYLHSHNEEALKDFAAIAQYRAQSSDANTKKFEAAYPILPCSHYVAYQAVYSNEKEKIEIIESQIPTSAINAVSSTTWLDPVVEYDSALSFNQIAASFALDKILPHTWKTQAETTNATPTDILQAQYRINNAKDLMDRLNAAKNRYHFLDLYLALNNILGDKFRKYKALENTYKQDSNPEITVDIPHEGSVFYYDTEYAIDSQNTVYQNVESIEQKKSEHSFKASNLDILFVKTETISAKKNASYKFKLAPTTNIEIDGNTETLAHFMQKNQTRVANDSIHFSTPKKADGPSIAIPEKATISVENGKVKISI